MFVGRNSFDDWILAIDSASAITFGQPCCIPKTEERGITRAQLREVYALVVQESAGWRAAEWLGGELLDLPPECINLYHVNDNLIKLKTEPFKCSYVELVSTAAQPPLWFVSQ